MTDTAHDTDNDSAPDTAEMSAEIERLRAKNAELLAELKAAKGKATESGSEVETLRAQVEDYRLHRPVADLLGKVLVASKYAAAELAEHFKFELNEAGEIEMRDTEGKPVLITEKVDGESVTRPIRLEEDEVWQYLAHDYQKLNHIVRGSKATGGGAQSNGRATSAPHRQAPAAPKGEGFGLR